MARQVLPIVGAVIGSFFMMPQLGFMVGSLIGNAVDPQVIKGPDLGDGQRSTTQEGSPRPRGWGTFCCGGHLLQAGKLEKRIKKTKQGKGGPTVKEEQFFITYAIAVCEGEINHISRIWEDENLVYDARPDGLLDVKDNREFMKNCTIYRGTETQMPDPHMEKITGLGNTCAYRGTAYIVFNDKNVTQRQGSIPTYRFEVSRSGIFNNAPNVTGDNRLYSIIQEENKVEIATIYSTEPDLARLSSSNIPNFSFDGEFVIARKNALTDNTNFIQIYQFNRLTNKYDILWKEFDYYNFIVEHNYKFNKVNNNLFRWNYKTSRLEVYKPNYETKTFDLIKEIQFPLRAEGSNRCYNFIINDNNTKIILNILNQIYYCFDFDNNTNNAFNINTGSTSGINLSPQLAGTQNFIFFGDILLSPRIISNTLRYDFIGINFDNTLSFINTSSSIGYYQGNIGSYGVATIKLKNMFCYVARDNASSLFKLRKATIKPNIINPGWYDLDFANIPNQENINLFPSFNTEDYQFIVARNNELIANSNSIKGWAVYKMDKENDQVYLDFTYDTPTGSPDVPNGYQFVTGINARAAFNGGWKVAEIIKDIASDLKINESLINTNDINDLEVDGFIVAQQYQANNVIRTLQEVFFFDASEYDNKINFLKRGKDVVEVISYNDLVNESYKLERKSAIEYPRKVELIYQSPKTGYSQAKAIAERLSPDLKVSGSVTQTTAITINNEDFAAQIADKIHKIAWAEAEGEVTLSLPMQYGYLTTADCIGFYTDLSLNHSLNPVAKRLRIEKIETADGIINLTCKTDRQTAYISTATGIPIPEPDKIPSRIAGDSVFAYLDIPALIDSQDKLGYYVSAVGLSDAWVYSDIQKLNSVNEYEDVVNVGLGANLGNILNDINPSSEHFADTTNEIIVQLPHDYDPLLSLTDEQLLQENNACAILRNDGSAEILQFRDVEDLGNNQYKLSYLLRGRLESGATFHPAGSQFLMLNDALFIETTANLIGTDFSHRVISNGQSADEAPTFEHPFIGRSQIEFSVKDLHFDNIESKIKWIPCERFGSDINPIRSVNWEHYLVEIIDATTTQEFITLDNFLDIDLNNFTGDLVVNVYQVNRLTGKGKISSINIEN